VTAVYLTQLRAALASIHARWEHGHDGLTPGCALCASEQAEVRAFGAVSRALTGPAVPSEPAAARNET
jgi:hypothetical protein